MNIFGIEIRSDAKRGSLGLDYHAWLIPLMGFTVFNYIYNGIFRPLFTEKIDFEAYYNAALSFRFGAPVYQHMVDFFRIGPFFYEGPLPYVYPPFFVIFLSPLAYVNFKTAAIIWLLLNNALFLTGFLMLLRAISKRYHTIQFLVVVFICLNFQPLFNDYLVGQCNVILFFLLTVGLFMYRRERPVYAGVALGIACLIKVIPGLILVYFLWKRQYALFLSGLLTIVIVFCYSLIFFDISIFIWYFRFMLDQNLFNAFHDNHSIMGVFSRLFTNTVWVKGLFNLPNINKLFVVLSSFAVLIIFFFRTQKRCLPSTWKALREYAMGIVTMLLLSKLTTTPYLIMLILPIVVVIKDIFEARPSKAWSMLLATAIGITAVWHPLSAGKFLDMKRYEMLLDGPQAALFSIQFFAMIVLWIWFAFGPFAARCDQCSGSEFEVVGGDTDGA